MNLPGLREHFAADQQHGFGAGGLWRIGRPGHPARLYCSGERVFVAAS